MGSSFSSELVRSSGGTLDKYIGDALVALWGAPRPVEGHPQRVCETAIRMQDEVAHLRGRPGLVGAERLRVGIGIHSGDAVVGNMGSDLHFEYSMTGDSVNLCSRLEGLTKYYGAEIIASGELMARVGGAAARELDRIRVKGSSRSVRIFEVLRPGVEYSAAWVRVWEAGLAAYRETRFDEATRAFREVLELRGEDLAARLLLARIAILERETPRDWDGTWTFEEK